MINILGYTNHIHKLPAISHVYLPSLSLNFSFPTYLPYELSQPHTYISALSASPCLLFALSIFNILICSTRYNSNERFEIARSFQRRHKVDFRFTVGQTVFSSIYGLCWSCKRARSKWNIEWYLRNNTQFRFNGQIIFSKV